MSTAPPVSKRNTSTIKKVMISGTALDLPEHRRMLLDACLRMAMFPIMMENLPAGDSDAISESLRMVDEADIYICILAYRYGYIPKGYDISITEMEYNRAFERSIPCLIFLMGENHPIRPSDIETGDGGIKLERFKSRLKAEKVVNYFNSPEELEAEAINSLANLRGLVPSEALSFASDYVINADEVNYAESDTPKTDSKDDRLDFKPYVDALHGFITAPETTTPLVIGINGSWGTGKSSLMFMLKRQLEPRRRYYLDMFWLGLAWHVGQFSRQKLKDWQKMDWEVINQRISTLRLSRRLLRLGHVFNPDTRYRILEHIAKSEPMEPLFYPTIWFNAWKFTEESQIWAALASDIINQLNSKQYALLTRLQFWFQLRRKRANLMPAMGHILLNLLVIAVLALASVLYPGFVHPFIVDHILPFFKDLLPTQSGATSAASATATVGGLALVLATGLQVIKAGYKISKTHPFQIPIKTIIENPNYQEKVGYISQFSEDFKRIVSVATRRSSNAWETQKLVIFIDDLDRCRPLQAVGIIEAISLLLDSEQCVFVLGIDADAVAASIEAKYKELVEKVYYTKPEIVSYGKAFLEKIIQISLNIPYADDIRMYQLIESLTQRGTSKPSQLEVYTTSSGKGNNYIPEMERSDRTQEMALKTQREVRAYFQKEAVQNALKDVGRLLKRNPRRIKQFINLFRLKVFLLNENEEKKNYFKDGEERLRDFATMLAWSLQWRELARLVVDSSHSVEICDYLLTLCEKLQPSIEPSSDQEVQTNTNAELFFNSPEPNDTSHYDPHILYDIVKDLIDRRDKMEKLPTHWYYLPWEEWIYDDGFRFCLLHFRNQWQSVIDGKFPMILKLIKI